MRVEKLFIIQDYGAHKPENRRVWQTLYKRQTDFRGLAEVERGRFSRDWNQR